MVMFSVGFHNTDTRPPNRPPSLTLLSVSPVARRAFDEPAVSGAVARHAHGRVVAQRRVEGGL